MKYYKASAKRGKCSKFLLTSASLITILSLAWLCPMNVAMAQEVISEPATSTSQNITQSENPAPIGGTNTALTAVSCDETGTGNFKCGTGSSNGSATNSTAIGNSATALGIEGTAIGHLSQALGNFSLAAGNNAFGAGYATSSLGVSSRAVGNGDIALGGQADTFKTGTQTNGNIAIGSSTGIVAGGTLGSFTIANGGNSIALGTAAQALAANATAMGALAQATGLRSVAIGGDGEDVEATIGAQATGEASTAIGNDAKAGSKYSSAIGANSSATGFAGFSLGAFSSASSSYSTAVGVASFALSDYGLAMGYSAVVQGVGSNIAIGRQSFSNGNGSIALGYLSNDNGLANVFSIGNASLLRKIIFVANGSVAAGSKDAVNGSQLFALCSLVSGCNAAALTTASNGEVSLASSNPAPVQTSEGADTVSNTGANTNANQNISQATIAARPVEVNLVTQDAASDIIALQALTATQGAAIASLQSGYTKLNDVVARNNSEARRGIALAISMAPAHFPSEAGKTSYSVNFGTFHDETAFSASFAHRFQSSTPIALTVGISQAGNKETGARIGIAGEF